jgi:hypothetical protein
MAPTKANATYAATTLNLLTKGPVKVIWKAPWFKSAARCSNKDNHPLCLKKSASLSLRHLGALRNVVKE